jgi:hypothetical protein
MHALCPVGVEGFEAVGGKKAKRKKKGAGGHTAFAGCGLQDTLNAPLVTLLPGMR